MTPTLLTRWNQYWFSGEGRLSLAVVRVAVGLSALLSYLNFHIDYGAFIARHPASLYVPRGILRLLGNAPPPLAFIQACEGAGIVFLLLFMAGWRARLTGTIALVAHLVLISLQFTFMPGWTHGYNMVYLAFLAVVWGPHERAAFTSVPGPKNDGARWPVLLAQAILSLCFFGAALWKIRSDLSFSWIWSDSLRYHMFTRYTLMDEPRTALVTWIMAEPWRYRGVALLNILAQALPLIAMFVPSNPRIRAVAGFFFILEIFGLAYVMELRNWHWLPLAAVYFDWDSLAKKWVSWRKSGVEADPAPPEPISTPATSGAGVFIFALLALHATVVLTDPTISGKLNAFPFTNFRLYVQIRAQASLGEHRDYQWVGARFSAEGVDSEAQAKAKEQIRKAKRSMQWLHLEMDAKRLAGHTEEFARLLADHGAAASTIRLWKDIQTADRYPLPVTMRVVRSGLNAVWEKGQLRSLSARRTTGADGRDCIRIEHEGALEEMLDFTTADDYLKEPASPRGHWDAARTTFCFQEPQGETVFAFVRVRFAGLPPETYLAAPLRRPAQSFTRRLMTAWTR